jgi:hypothetical protein
MYLLDLAKIICINGTASETRQITVKAHTKKNKVLWRGKAKDLKTMENIKNWLVVEILIDEEDKTTNVEYNKGKIITVI